MKTIETIKCPCGESFQWENDPNPTWPYDYRPDLCPPCSERQEAEFQAQQLRAKIEKQAAHAREKAQNKLPRLFHGTDTAHPAFNRSAWSKIKDHKLTMEKPWLGLVGATGLSKSRMAALFFIQEADTIVRIWKSNDWRRDPSFVFVTGYRLCELAGIVSTGSFGQKEDARKELERITTSDLLLIDDLGKGRITESVAAVLFALINERYANVERTIWTANSRPEEIAATMNSDTAAPFAGRLNDHSKIFNLKSRP